jgi:F-type H+-transporting ATPase subunit delta
MMGTSRGSLAHAKQRLAEVLAGGADAGQLGDELFAVTGLLDAEHALRRALADPTRPDDAKTHLVHALLDGKVAPGTVDLVSYLVTERWSEPPDLSGAVEQLAALAIIEVAERDGKLDELEDELFRFGRVVNGSPGLRVALSNPFFPVDRKRGLLEALLGGKVSQPTMRLVTQGAVYSRGRTLDASLEEYAGLAAERRQRLVAEVHVAVALTDGQRGRLAAALAAAYGRDVHLNIVLDPKVIGGMSVHIAGELIDGTTAGQLAGLRRRLAA